MFTPFSVDLEKYYSATNPRGSYRKIHDYLLQRQFSHEQYSGYHSQYKTTDLEIFDLVYEMNKESINHDFSFKDVIIQPNAP